MSGAACVGVGGVAGVVGVESTVTTGPELEGTLVPDTVVFGVVLPELATVVVVRVVRFTVVVLASIVPLESSLKLLARHLPG